jgi:hypothetical protein
VLEESTLEDCRLSLQLPVSLNERHAVECKRDEEYDIGDCKTLGFGWLPQLMNALSKGEHRARNKNAK